MNKTEELALLEQVAARELARGNPTYAHLTLTDNMTVGELRKALEQFPDTAKILSTSYDARVEDKGSYIRFPVEVLTVAPEVLVTPRDPFKNANA